MRNDIMRIMRRGKFIVLDGLDGSGKGTQTVKLAEYLFRKDKIFHPVLTREPFNSDYYDPIRKILKESQDPKSRADELAALFVKDRKVHAEIISYLLRHGFDVISDRYKYSTLAYQQTQGILLAQLLEMHEGILVPDLVIILDIPVRVALERIVKDAGREYKEMFEQEEFQEQLRRNFLKFPKQLSKEKIVMLDGNRPPEEVFESIRKEVDKIL